MNILLVGKSGAGKDLAMKHLCSIHNFNIKRFAEPIKDFLHNKFFISYDILNSSKKNNILINGVSIRDCMINIAKACKKKYGENIFIDLLFKGEKKVNNYLIVDGRFDNEIKACKKKGFIIIFIHRKSESKTDVGVKGLSKNISKEYDYIIDNNSSEKNLYNKLKTIYEIEKEKYNNKDNNSIS